MHIEVFRVSRSTRRRPGLLFSGGALSPLGGGVLLSVTKAEAQGARVYIRSGTPRMLSMPKTLPSGRRRSGRQKRSPKRAVRARLGTIQIISCRSEHVAYRAVQGIPVHWTIVLCVALIIYVLLSILGITEFPE